MLYRKYIHDNLGKPKSSPDPQRLCVFGDRRSISHEQLYGCKTGLKAHDHTISFPPAGGAEIPVIGSRSHNTCVTDYVPDCSILVKRR